MGNYSAHADQTELVDWIIERGPVTSGLFLNHGDDDARAVLRDLLDSKGIDKSKIHCPSFDQSFELVAGQKAVSIDQPAPRMQPVQMERDWNNEYVEFMMQLNEKLASAKTDQEKRELIVQLRSAL